MRETANKICKAISIWFALRWFLDCNLNQYILQFDDDRHILWIRQHLSDNRYTSCFYRSVLVPFEFSELSFLSGDGSVVCNTGSVLLDNKLQVGRFRMVINTSHIHNLTGWSINKSAYVALHKNFSNSTNKIVWKYKPQYQSHESVPRQIEFILAFIRIGFWFFWLISQQKLLECIDSEYKI